ncbi:hypothetical protein PHLGIDRAFT_111449, partial [Phlebiopsis gigantea 11061_1 CR5-6]
MLQYSVQLPPLSLSSSKPKARKAASASAPPPPLPSTDTAHDSHPTMFKRTGTAGRSRSTISSGPAYGHSIPLAISTAFPPPHQSSQASGRASPSSPSFSMPSSSLSSPSLPPTPSLGSSFPFPQQTQKAPSPRLSSAQLSKASTRSPFFTSSALPSVPVPVPGTRSPRLSKAAPLPLSQGLPSPALPSPVVLHSATNSYYEQTASGASSMRSSFSSSAIDVLSPGDVIGEGSDLQGQLVRRVSVLGEPQDEEQPAKTFRVVRKLGAGSYAVVYLVQEVLRLGDIEETDEECESDGGDLDMSMDGHDRDEVCVVKERRSEPVYGKEYAIKVLSKANLDEEALSAQLLEATIHQSIPAHPNVVTLHRTLETQAYLLLLLEFVPGEDLFYFLEQSRDHYDPSAISPTTPSAALPSTSPSGSSDCSMSSETSARTPPTPSLLATLSPNKLLSRTRLKLIASMFKQMCDAVAACHERGVFHRDIKPENFIVTDGFLEVLVPGLGGFEEVRRERRVVVKLTDFGLSTTEVHSADMDCGSAPYMSYECRNNIHPTYMPRAADVWSLGIVLINMLYHYNPWTDTTQRACSAFSLFQQNPVGFFTSRFAGMTPPVAEFLANKVFCILPDPMDDSPRVTAKEFGLWIRDLPDLLSPPLRPGHHSRAASFSVNLTEVPGYSLASVPHSRRPSLRSAAGSRTPSLLPPPQRASWATSSISRQPSLGAFEEVEQEGFPASGLPPVHDHEIEEEADLEEELQNDESNSRSASTQKRRRRGRKGKGAAPVVAPAPALVDDSIANLAQALARELSKTAKRASGANVSSPLATSTVYNSTDAQTQQPIPPTLPPVPVPVAAPAPMITKKPSKWKLGFGKSSSNNGSSAASSLAGVKEDQSTASKATSLIMGLNAPSTSSQLKAAAHASTHPYGHGHTGPSAPSASSTSFISHATTRHGPASANSSVVSLDDPAWQRGRR